MGRLTTYRVSMTTALLAISAPASAHTGLDAGQSFMAGFTHPWHGLDHVLVMVAIGLAASRPGKRIFWQLPLTFLALMAAGAYLYAIGLPFPAAEQWVALSVSAAGIILWHRRPKPTVLLFGLTAFFALPHGYVHALELGQDTGRFAYAPGFLLATAMLHGLGILVGRFGIQAATMIRAAVALLCTVAGLILLAG